MAACVMRQDLELARQLADHRIPDGAVEGERMDEGEAWLAGGGMQRIGELRAVRGFGFRHHANAAGWLTGK